MRRATYLYCGLLSVQSKSQETKHVRHYLSGKTELDVVLIGSCRRSSLVGYVLAGYDFAEVVV